MTRRDEILNYIAEYAVDHHNAPSTYEIAVEFKVSQHTVYMHLVKLCAEQRLVMVDGKWKIPEGEYVKPKWME